MSAREIADAIDDLDGPTPCAAFLERLRGKPSLGLCHHGGPDGTDSYSHRITGHGLTGEGPTLPDALRDWIRRARA